MIIDRTYDLLSSRYGNLIEELTIADVRVGLFLTAVKLSDGSIGTASSLEDDHPFRLKADRDFGEFTPLKIKNRTVKELFESNKPTRLVSSLRVAVLSAISSGIISNGNYRIIEGDPVSMIDLGGRKNVTIVGAFQSYIQKISETRNNLKVLELRKSALLPEQEKYFVPAEEYKNILPETDILIITGQTLVNKTIDELLLSIRPGAEVVVTGPSGSILPDILFERGVTMIGASRYIKPGLVFEAVSQAGMGYHLFEYCAIKITVLPGDGPKA